MGKVDRDKFISYFKLKKMGGKGWYVGNCPFCKKEKHFGINFNREMGSYNCFKCLNHGHLYELVKVFKLPELLGVRYIENFTLLEKRELFTNTIIAEESVDFSEISISPPHYYKRIYRNNYLQKRKFEEEHFLINSIGVCKESDYVTFLVQEGEEIKGFVKRSTHSKEWIDAYNKRFSKKYLRWDNSLSNFGKLIYGYNQITPSTKLVILVEGITSKANIDRLLNLYYDSKICCIVTFGKKITKEQILKILSIGESVEKIILLYDGDVGKVLKTTSLFLSEFVNVEVGILNKDKDPGDLILPELMSILDRLKNPFEIL